jgi:isopenicillin N synthase-like dioxygenase
MQIPLIDLTGALQPGSPRSAEVARQIRAAGLSAGFFYVRGHGVSVTLIERQFEATRALFDLPMAAKEAVSLKNSPCMRGYEALGAQTLDAQARPDLKESFYCGIAYPPEHPYVRQNFYSYGANQWPATLPGLQAQCEEYIGAMLALARRMMQLMALSLDLPETFFDAGTHSPMVTLRLLRYPPHPADADERSFGAGAHTDWGAITLLAQDGHGGLEVQMPDGAWAATTPVPETLVVNLGDMVPRWTNGLYHSNPHRVRNLHSGGQPRHSIPFFYSPDYQARVEPVPSCVSADIPARFAPCTAGEHLQQMAAQTYGLTP